MAATLAPRSTGNPQPAAAAAQAPSMPIPFTRAARRKSIQAYTGTFTLTAGSTTQLPPILLPPAGFIRDIEMVLTVTSTGNTATVAAAAVSDIPFNIINSMLVTNAAGDTIYVPINGYQLYLIDKWSGIYQQPFCDPRADQAFIPLTTGAAATAGSGIVFMRLPFEIDPRDAFCALPNLAANKAYEIVMNLASTAQIWSGGTPPNGVVTISVVMTMNFWSQPNPTTAGGNVNVETSPAGVGSVSLFRLQTIPVGGGGNKVFQLINVGNAIRWTAFSLYDNASPSKRTDADWPPITYLRLNNDPLFYKPLNNWLSNMRRANGYGGSYGGATIAKDIAMGLDTGVYILSDFIEQHGSVEVDSPRDQYLVTLESTLWQLEGNLFGNNANILNVLSNEIKPISATAMYSLNYI